MHTCLICGEINIEELIKWDYYKIYKCFNCKLIFADPLPSSSQLLNFYQGFLFKQPDMSVIRKEIESRKKEILRLFNPSDKKQQSFLDYGGGTGVVFKAVSDLGLNPYYYDIDEEAIHFTKANFGLESSQMIKDIETCEIKFDFIFSDNVIEHIRDPYHFIKSLHNKLEDGGVLILKTPNASNTETYFNPFIVIQSYFLRAIPSNGTLKSLKVLFKRSWHCDPPRHIYSFTPESFDYLMHKLQVSKKNYEISFYSTPWFSNTLTKHFFSKDKHNNVFKSILIRLLVWPVVLAEILMQLLKWLLIKLNLVSQSGLVLRIIK